MLKRFLTGIVLVAITIGFFALRFVSPYIMDVYFLAIVLYAGFEMSRAFANIKKKNDMYFILSYPILSYVSVVLCANAKLSIYLTILVMIVIFSVLKLGRPYLLFFPLLNKI